MRSFASLTLLTKFIWLLLHVAIQVEFVLGRGPDNLQTLPVYIWPFSITNCSSFRNETVLRLKFGVWPEDIPGAPFQYCCEYQPNGALTGFELSNYTYSPDGGTLQPSPYYDLGILENKHQHYAYYWRYWRFWMLPQKKNFNVPMLYCDATDLRALYLHRNWNNVLTRGVISWAILVGTLTLVVSTLLVLGKKYNIGIYKTKEGQVPKPCLDKEEAFADACHILLLSVVGSSLMEGIARSPIRSWRSDLMFNGAVTYSYLTLFATISACTRHCVSLELRHQPGDSGWLWQKVFGQFVAQFIVGMYFVLDRGRRDGA